VREVDTLSLLDLTGLKNGTSQGISGPVAAKLLASLHDNPHSINVQVGFAGLYYFADLHHLLMMAVAENPIALSSFHSVQWQQYGFKYITIGGQKTD
jgi:hypothetical protein